MEFSGEVFIVIIFFVILHQGSPYFLYSYIMGLQPFWSQGHKLLHNSFKAGHLTLCHYFGICFILN